MMKFLVLVVCMIFSFKSWFMTSVFTLLVLVSVLSTFTHWESFGLLCQGVAWDSVSISLVVLTLWVSCLSVYASIGTFKSAGFKGMFMVMSTMLLVVLILSFTFSSLVLFYISFEFSLFPMLMIILGWGYQPERVQAGVYMFLYTIFASLPLLLVIVYISGLIKVMNFVSQVDLMSGFWSDYLFMGFMLFAFAVKLPVYFTHLWLPKAHVEAPVGGSMILAGVLLKLGGYGIIRCLPFFQSVVSMVSWLGASIVILGGSFVSILSLRQVDMKSLIAYSSVAHMSLVFGGLSTMGLWGIKGSVMLMVGHGLCSSGMFFVANVSYERSKSRSLFLNKGLLSLAPSLTIFWFLLSIGNMAAPPTLNLFSEISVIISLYGVSKIYLFPVLSMCFFSASYSLFLYVASQHGKVSQNIDGFFSVKVYEFLVMASHLIPLNTLFFIMYMF